MGVVVQEDDGPLPRLEALSDVLGPIKLSQRRRKALIAGVDQLLYSVGPVVYSPVPRSILGDSSLVCF